MPSTLEPDLSAHHLHPLLLGTVQWPALAAAVPLASAVVTPSPHWKTLANTHARRSTSGCFPWFLELSPHLFASLTLCSTAGSGLEIPDPPGSDGSQHTPLIPALERQGKWTTRAPQRNPVLNHCQHQHHSLKKQNGRSRTENCTQTEHLKTGCVSTVITVLYLSVLPRTYVQEMRCLRLLN